MMEVLILVHLQNDYFRGGVMELSGMEQAEVNARRLRMIGPGMGLEQGPL